MGHTCTYRSVYPSEYTSTILTSPYLHTHTQVRLGDRVGLIPDNFVEILPASPPPIRRPSASTRTTQPSPPQPQQQEPKVKVCDIIITSLLPTCTCNIVYVQHSQHQTWQNQ